MLEEISISSVRRRFTDSRRARKSRTRLRMWLLSQFLIVEVLEERPCAPALSKRFWPITADRLW